MPIAPLSLSGTGSMMNGDVGLEVISRTAPIRTASQPRPKGAPASPSALLISQRYRPPLAHVILLFGKSATRVGVVIARRPTVGSSPINPGDRTAPLLI